MSSFPTIVRGTLAAAIAAVYLMMAFASVTHDLTHWSEHAHGGPASSGGILAESGDHGGHADDATPLGSAADFCFFCAHSPTFLPAVVAMLLAGLVIVRPVYTSAIPEKPIVPPSFPSLSLRAPPLFG
jgi:hypothetical protein